MLGVLRRVGPAVVFKTLHEKSARPRMARRTRAIAMLTATLALAGVGAAAPVHAAPAPDSGWLGGAKAAPWTGPEHDAGVRAAAPAAPYGEFTALPPFRMMDTRIGTGQPGPGPIGEFQTRSLQITGRGGVPASGVAAVVLNVTVDQPTYGGYLTVWPHGSSKPTTSNLNFVANQTVPNLVTVGVGTGGQVDFYNRLGRTDVIADVVGYYSDASGAAGSRYHPVNASRIVDSRIGQGTIPGPRSPQSVTKIDFGAGKGILATTATAVVLNVTVTNATGSGWFTVYPDDTGTPNASNVNFVPGTTRANQVIVKVPANGLVDVYFGGWGLADLVIDISGYYDNVKTTDAGRFVPSATPYRSFDGRPYGATYLLGQGEALLMSPLGEGDIPATGVSAVLVNLTATEGTWDGFFSVFPTDVSAPPTVSSLNFRANETVPNHVIAALSKAPAGNPPIEAGSFAILNGIGNTHVVLDTYGYFT